eukprot:TRINITY_DN18910_c0_g1_i2.p1 TRINITY_DN18910_c0_g1~~TRINITY_DN18910_c0_g1_i2.p1  ORF type:complete len:424 (+),score=105.53 TRINITY_DN18910_c0_g1_i2:67-1338(+)
MSGFFFFFQAEDGIRDAQESRGLGDVYKRQDQAQDAVSAAHDPEELEAAQRELDKVVHLIQNGTNVYFDDLSQLTKQEVRTYHGDIDGSKLFGDYPLHPNQTILVAPPYREPPEVPPRRITMWFNGKKDNVGAAFVKVRTSEKNQLPAFVPEPCWTGEELVAYGNLNVGKWEADILANPQDSFALRRLGRARAAVGELAEAIEFYNKALAIDPEYSYAKRDLAMAHFHRGNAPEALSLLREVLQENDGRYGQAWCDLGDVLASEGDWSGAKHHYTQALELDYNHNVSSTATNVPSTSAKAAALRGLGSCACASNKMEQGIALLQQALGLAPADHVTRQMIQLAQSKTKLQSNDAEWRQRSRLSMIHGQVISADPTRAAQAAKLLEAGIRGSKHQDVSTTDLLRLGSALYLKQSSVHAPEADMF